MTAPNVEFGREGAKRALVTRQSLGLPFDTALCVWDIAERLGVDVRFDGRNSFEGLYQKGAPPRIFVGARRPPGRRVFSCAHELGHHVCGHGTRADEYLADGERYEADAPEERLANAFAAHLLMPAAAVRRAFALREWDVTRPTPKQAYVIAESLGVGYETLVLHLGCAMRSIPFERMRELRTVRPKDIQAEFTPLASEGRVVPVGRAWTDRAVDLDVGDVVLLPPGATAHSGPLDLSRREASKTIMRAVSPGVTRAETPDGWTVDVRVSRWQFVGRSRFRHLPDPEPDDPEEDDDDEV